MTNWNWDEWMAEVMVHDLTFEFSDDPKYYNKGRQHLREIREQALKFDREKVIEFWNAQCDRKLVAGAAETFYWED